MTLDLSKYLGLFVSEATEHLSRFAAELVRLEAASHRGDDVAPIIDELFRRAHSVKGMAGAMSLDAIATVAHAVEDLVDVFRRRAAAPDAPAVDVLLAAVDALSALVERAAQGAALEADAALVARLRGEAQRVTGALTGGPKAPSDPPPPASGGRAGERGGAEWP
jgi:two-component system chemotaxis sensor kinase CheA